MFFTSISSTYISDNPSVYAADTNAILSDALFNEKEKYKAICDDLDGTFAELTGY